MPLNTSLVVCLSLALLLAVWALAREVRLRRTLQELLARLFARWRAQDEKTRVGDADADVRHHGLR